jgi:hypothetical protein
MSLTDSFKSFGAWLSALIRTLRARWRSFRIFVWNEYCIFTPKHRCLWGESIREIGVLLIVFVPLDILVGPKRAEINQVLPGWMHLGQFADARDTLLLFFLAFGLLMVYFGARVEAKASTGSKVP